MRKNISLVGGNGDGQTCKVAKQIIVALNIQAAGEALLFASKASARRSKFMDLETLNNMQQDEFAAELADIFEHLKWVAERAWSQRPFAVVDALHAVMVREVAAAELEAQLHLLCARPQLAGKESRTGELTSASESESEQAGANLDSLSADEKATINRLNQ